MEGFDGIFQAATAAIEPPYFHLPVYGSLPVHRERVYCYELYHQMRSRWTQGQPFLLNGEVDKQAHPYFGGASSPKPDLLVHVPGSENNFAAIEVKSGRGTKAGIRKDLKTLQRFRSVGYQRAIFLMYAAPPGELMDRIQNCGADAEFLVGVEFWSHEHIGTPAIRLEGVVP